MADQRLAIVTGGARGIGRAIVMALLKQGRKVAALDINTEQLAELEKVAGEAGFSVITKVCDITKTADFCALLDQISDENGGCGILVNNAGITRDKLMMQMEEPDYDILMNINLKAAFMAAKTVVRPMIRNKWGRIINISSIAGLVGQRGSANYAASKAALIGMSKSLAREVGKKNVTVNCIAPGFIETDMTKTLHPQVKEAALAVIPMEKQGQPEDVAAAVAFLASDAAGYITGETIRVDGGMAM
ncbi:MAG: 3-oxoacyl-[acyl-carrier-protein] reductase [Planctomycetes bacterium GWC2_49_10]|nr:MAG: 3-oxoacyl-[acyl-carrier-protein] reductase [Planctomycetes bacterium GWC2_49_10]